MINWLVEKLTGLPIADLRRMAKQSERERRRQEAMALLLTLPDAVSSAMWHSGMNTKHLPDLPFEASAAVAKHLAIATKIALPYCEANPEKFIQWYKNHATPGELFYADSLAKSNKLRNEVTLDEVKVDED